MSPDSLSFSSHSLNPWKLLRRFIAWNTVDLGTEFNDNLSSRSRFFPKFFEFHLQNDTRGSQAAQDGDTIAILRIVCGCCLAWHWQVYGSSVNKQMPNIESCRVFVTSKTMLYVVCVCFHALPCSIFLPTTISKGCVCYFWENISINIYQRINFFPRSWMPRQKLFIACTHISTYFKSVV